MTRKRARTDEGHFVKDDPDTPENEAYVNPSDTAKKNRAPKNTNKSAFVMYVSANEENAAFDIILDEDTKVSGTWDENRSFVHWKVPRAINETIKLHHHIWSGRILCCEDD
jgi:hypothetical protein